MFLFFAVTGTSVQYRLLAQRMPTYQVIGVDNLHTNQPEAYLSITSMAADLAAILRREQPRGLYTLGSFSFGGLVAWGRRDSQSAAVGQETLETMYERLFDIPNREIADPVTTPELAEFRNMLLTQAHHNLAIYDVVRPEVLHLFC
ncbi:hypothetical protein N7501_001591 [Penicillium viridicatum]|nr:hypothetical protein N7501_001591 [Penicillium viridicatum]